MRRNAEGDVKPPRILEPKPRAQNPNQPSTSISTCEAGPQDHLQEPLHKSSSDQLHGDQSKMRPGIQVDGKVKAPMIFKPRSRSQLRKSEPLSTHVRSHEVDLSTTLQDARQTTSPDHLHREELEMRSDIEGEVKPPRIFKPRPRPYPPLPPAPTLSREFEPNDCQQNMMLLSDANQIECGNYRVQGEAEQVLVVDNSAERPQLPSSTDHEGIKLSASQEIQGQVKINARTAKNLP